MATAFKLPELGEGVESADVSQIYVQRDDRIESDQNVMELETEKAVAELPCPYAGIVTEVHVSEGDTIEVGQTLLTIDEGKAEEEEEANRDQSAQRSSDERSQADADERPSQPETETDQQASEQDGQPQPQLKDETVSDEPEAEREKPSTETKETAETREKDEEEVSTKAESAATELRDQSARQHLPTPAGPATRRLARKLNVDLNEFQPKKGERIRTEDVVRAFVESGKATALYDETLPDFTRFGPVDREPLNKIAQTAARRLSASWRSVPHVTQHGLADITDLEQARRRYLERAENAAAKITLTSIALKSVAGLLKEFPKFNASLDTKSDELILKKHYHIGVAVDTHHGLLVPVIRDVDRKNVEQIAHDLEVAAEKARHRKLGQSDFEGGTFTVSNQGGIGGGEFTPIVNHPEVAILGMGRARVELRMVDSRPTERLLLPLSLSYDHRVINGADAARFIDRLATILSDEFALLIAV